MSITAKDVAIQNLKHFLTRGIPTYLSRSKTATTAVYGIYVTEYPGTVPAFLTEYPGTVPAFFTTFRHPLTRGGAQGVDW